MSQKLFSRKSRFVYVFMCFVLRLQVQCEIRDFVTLRNYQKNDLHKNATFESETQLGSYKIKYAMRFQPLEIENRKFLLKLPCRQQVPATTTTTNTSPSTEIPTEPITEPTIPEEPTTITTTTTKKPPKTTIRTTTTMTNLLKPTTFLPSWKQSLKSLWLFGSPGKINLLQSSSVKTKPKSKGFLNLFEVIKFDNHKCNVSLGDIRSMEGICYHEFECKSYGGIPTELCGDGAGVCCICKHKFIFPFLTLASS